MYEIVPPTTRILMHILAFAQASGQRCGDLLEGWNDIQTSIEVLQRAAEPPCADCDKARDWAQAAIRVTRRVDLASGGHYY